MLNTRRLDGRGWNCSHDCGPDWRRARRSGVVFLVIATAAIAVIASTGLADEVKSVRALLAPPVPALAVRIGLAAASLGLALGWWFWNEALNSRGPWAVQEASAIASRFYQGLMHGLLYVSIFRVIDIVIRIPLFLEIATLVSGAASFAVLIAWGNPLQIKAPLPIEFVYAWTFSAGTAALIVCYFVMAATIRLSARALVRARTGLSQIR